MRTLRETIDDAQNMTDGGYSILNIALVKSYTYCEEYDTNSGKVVDKENAYALKQGFIDGFLAGFAHRLGGD